MPADWLIKGAAVVGYKLQGLTRQEPSLRAMCRRLCSGARLLVWLPFFCALGCLSVLPATDAPDHFLTAQKKGTPHLQDTGNGAFGLLCHL